MTSGVDQKRPVDGTLGRYHCAAACPVGLTAEMGPQTISDGSRRGGES